MALSPCSGVFVAREPDRNLARALELLGLPAGEDRIQRFEPQGTSWVRRTGGAWAALHTWPEQALVTVDVYRDEPASLDALEALGWRPAAAPLELSDGWRGGRRHAYRLSRVLERHDSPRQRIVLGEGPGLGRCLFLDDRLHLCERDAPLWHQALAMPALAAHPSPRSVLVWGGDTGGVAAEVLSTPGVERVHVVPADPVLVRLARAHLPTWHRGVFEDARLTVGPLPDRSGWDVALVEGPRPQALPPTEVAAWIGTGVIDYRVEQAGAGRSRGLTVTAPPHRDLERRSHWSKGLWERMRALARGAEGRHPDER